MAFDKRVLVFGASGTAGSGAVRALLRHGYGVTCVLRSERSVSALPAGVEVVYGDVTAPEMGLAGALSAEKFDVVVSCLASRSGGAKDAWAIDHDAQVTVLDLTKQIGATHFILLSAICVQKPTLPFQHAKLAFEAKLIASGLTYSIVRPTAFFKSLSGQIERLRRGKPFLVFGDGTLTACKPISDDDLGDYVAGCIEDDTRQNRILPIGGPGDAITPKEQGEVLFRLLGREPNFKHVPIAMMGVIHNVLRCAGLVSVKAAEKAGLAQIGQYYASESMLVWNAEQGKYDADKTPSTGTETLFEYYAKVIESGVAIERGDHSVF